MPKTFARKIRDYQGREPDGLSASAFSERLEGLLAEAYSRVEQGSSIRRDKRLVIVVTDLTMDRLAALASRFEYEGDWERATKSGLANYLVNVALPLVEAEMIHGGRQSAGEGVCAGVGVHKRGLE